MNENAIRFDCNGAPLVGILHKPERRTKRGILIAVAGGPQYRVGGHRQLVLWARRMAAEGYAVFRFDYRGWGDSDARWVRDESTATGVKAGRELREVVEHSFRLAIEDVVAAQSIQARFFSRWYGSGNHEVREP